LFHLAAAGCLRPCLPKGGTLVEARSAIEGSDCFGTSELIGWGAFGSAEDIPHLQGHCQLASSLDQSERQAPVQHLHHWKPPCLCELRDKAGLQLEKFISNRIREDQRKEDSYRRRRIFTAVWFKHGSKPCIYQTPVE
jgi:hypothetical protein